MCQPFTMITVATVGFLVGMPLRAQVIVPPRRDTLPPSVAVPAPPVDRERQAAELAAAQLRSAAEARYRRGAELYRVRAAHSTSRPAASFLPRCATAIELPDTLAFRVARHRAAEVATGPDWSPEYWEVDEDAYVRAHVVDGGCQPGRAAPEDQVVLALVERDGRYALVSLKSQVDEFDGFADRVVLGLPGQEEPAIFFYDAPVERWTLLTRSASTARRVKIGEAEAAAAAVAARRIAAAQRAQELREEAAKRAELRARGWAPGIVDAILAGRVVLGMTAAQVRASWGAPNAINQTIGPSGVTEQWVYGLSGYVYFAGDRVVTIQTQR